MKYISGLWVPKNDTYFSHVLQKYGAFEPGRLEAALRYVQRFTLAVDVGGHIGLRSRELAPRFSSVIVYEPNPPTFQCLIQNISSFSNVLCYNVALGNEEKEVSMKESETRPGNSGSWYVTEGSGIQMRTLDSFGLQDVNFLKIDAEGYELPILQGGEETILQSRPVILLEEKNFKDRNGRMPVDYREAGHLLEQWGAKRIRQIKNDSIFIWEI